MQATKTSRGAAFGRVTGSHQKTSVPRGMASWLLLVMVFFIGLMVSAPAHADLYKAQTCPDDSLFCIEPEDYSLMWLRTAFPELVSAVTGTTSGGVGQPDGADKGDTGTLTENLLLSKMMKVLNSAALAVASILLSYKILAGVVQTANDGEVLGKRWSTLWGPLRVVTAAGLLVPTASGYSLVQAIIIMVAVMGIGFANGAWRVVVDHIVNGGALTAPAASEQSIEIARRVFANNICMHAVNLVYTELLNAGDGGANPYKQVKSDGYSSLPWAWMDGVPNYTPKTGANIVMDYPAVYRRQETFNNGFLWRMGWTASKNISNADTGLNQDVCGSMRLERNIGGAVDKSDPNTWADDISNGFKVIGGFAYSAPNNTVKQAEYQKLILGVETAAVDKMARALDGPAMTIVRSWYPFGDNGSSVLPDFANQNDQAALMNDIRTTIINAATDYEVDLAANMQTYRNQIADNQSFRDEFKGYALSRGWAAAGEWYLTIARLNQMAQDLNRSNPDELSEPTVYDFFRNLSTRSKEEAERFAALYEHIKTAHDTIIRTGEATATLYQSGDKGDVARKFSEEIVESHGNPAQGLAPWLTGKVGKALDDVIGGIGRTLASVAGTVVGLPLNTNTTNPLVTIIDGGRYMADVGFALLLTENIAKPFREENTTVNENGDKVTTASAAGWWAFIVGIAFPFLILPGLLMGYLLPLLPWVLWVSALLGWFILVVEAVIAGPLWALAHMRMDGEGISGPMGEQGYRLALSVMLRPLLMIVGLIAGLVVLTIFIPFIGASIWVAEAVNDAVGVEDGLLMRLAIMAVQSFLMVYVCYRCFNLITHVPDRVLRWIGQGGEGLGESEPVEQSKALFVGGLGNFARIGGVGGPVITAVQKAGGSSQGEVQQGQGGSGRGNSQNQNQTRIT